MSVACGIIGTYIVARRMVFISGGITHASFGGVYDHTVKEELNSSQTSLYVTIGFRFGVPAEK